MIGLPFSAMFELTYVIAIITLYSRLQSLLKVIKNSQNLEINELKLINFIYINFNDSLQMINQIFSFNLLIGLTEIFVHITITAFVAYLVIVSEVKFELFIFFLIGFAYFLSKAQIYLTFLAYSNLLRSSGNELWIEINFKKYLNKKVEKFREIVVNNVKFNELIVSCGSFEFNFIVLFSILTGACSYLVVMIQFDFVI